MRGGVVRGFGGPGAILVEDVPVPVADANQVLIKVKASSVNKLDTTIRSGEGPNPPPLPYITGRDGAGVVEQVGPGAEKFNVGDRVFFVSSKNGANADYVAVDINFVFPLPSRVTFAQGATLGIAYFAAYRALFVKAYAQAGQSILVHGASGGVGVAVSQIAKVHGLRVAGTASTEEGRRIAKEKGLCEQVYDHSDPGYIEKILSEHPHGFNVIVEMAASKNLQSDVKLLAPHGRVIVVGTQGALQIDPTEALAKEAAIIGLFTDDTEAGEYARIGERIHGLLDGGHITPFVGRRFPLEQLPDAHAQIEQPGAQGKIVLLHDADAEEGAAPVAAPPQPEPVDEPQPQPAEPEPAQPVAAPADPEPAQPEPQPEPEPQEDPAAVPAPVPEDQPQENSGDLDFSQL